MAAFAAEHPHVALSLVEGITRRLLARLEGDDADLAVVSAFPGQDLDRDRFELVHLLDDAMLVAFPVSHRLARRRRVRLADLEGERWVGADSGDDDRLLGPGRPATAPPSDFSVRDWPAKLGLVAAGLGITLVPWLAADAGRAGIALVRLDGAAPRRIYAATLRGATRAPAADAFIAILGELA
jgi:DNA-binding transcriptional LysR family regulator